MFCYRRVQTFSICFRILTELWQKCWARGLTIVGEVMNWWKNSKSRFSSGSGASSSSEILEGVSFFELNFFFSSFVDFEDFEDFDDLEELLELDFLEDLFLSPEFLFILAPTNSSSLLSDNFCLFYSGWIYFSSS